MPLLVECKCGKKLKVRDEHAGKKVKCPTCGATLVAPTPTPAVEEPVELLEMIEEDKAPRAVPASTAVKTSPPAWENQEEAGAAAWDAKKKSASPRKKDEDEEEVADDDEEPTPYWLFPGTLSTEVMALTPEGIYFVSLKGDALKRAEKLMKNCTHAAEALGEKAVYFPWEWITSIESNKRLCAFSIHYNNGEAMLSKVLTPAAHATRDEIMEEITEYLAPTWVMTVNKLTPVTATILPLVCITIDVLVTVGLAILAHYLVDAGEFRGWGRGAAVAALLNLLGWMGPIWTGVVGFVIALLLGVWLLVRVAFPPIEMSVHRKPDVALDEEE
jgi:hypothetical protein